MATIRAEFKAYALRFAQASLVTVGQSAACNRLHSTTERCARWLLMAHDRITGDLLLLTQEYLGDMLGVRRSAVNIAASALQEAGFISYSRGQIAIRNRTGLEFSACECYAALANGWKEIMGYTMSKSKT